MCKYAKLFAHQFISNSSNTISVDENWQCFKEFMHKIINECIPHKNINLRHKRPPWLNKEIRNLINQRNMLSKISLATHNQIDRDRYKKCRNIVSKKCEQAYQNHLNKVISNVHEDPRGFYKFINSKKTDNSSIPPLKNINSNNLLTSSIEKATCLNKYFASVFTTENLKNMPSIKKPSKYPDMPDILVTEPGVQTQLQNLNSKKSMGPDGISPRVLKELSSEISPVLTYIFNKSLKTGEIPIDWKLANIFALHKKGPKNLPENYRPISLTCICSKIMEHIVYSSISRFLSLNNILVPNQHGFRPGFSCETQLVLSINDWSASLDSGHRTDVAVFDFSKAFDSVPHQKLLLKLKSYGISGTTIRWISSFILNRKQRVVVDGSQSSWLPVISGVPQGTVLGPLLFLLFINDIDCGIKSNIRLFADDCILYRMISSEEDSKILQRDINLLSQWTTKWQMQLNIKKCHLLSISRLHDKIKPLYKIGTTPLTNTDSCTYLGVTVTNDLRWSTHVSNCSKKATRTLNFVRRNIYGCTPETKSLAYTSLVRPHLEYSSAAWDPYNKKDINLLGAVQRRAARFVHKNYKHSTSATKLMNELQWPNLADRRRNSRLIQFYKALYGQSPISLSHLLKPTRNTRSASDRLSYIPLSSRTMFISIPSSPELS